MWVKSQEICTKCWRGNSLEGFCRNFKPKFNTRYRALNGNEIRFSTSGMKADSILCASSFSVVTPTVYFH